MRLRAFGILLLVAALDARAWAQSYGANARVRRDGFDSVHATSAVDSEQARKASAGNAGQMLESADSVTVQRTSSASAAPFVRGLTGYRVLVMLDDLRLNNALTRAGSNALLNLIDPESIAAMEVVRGPASVMHGSDALGGVVRVRTHRTQVRPVAEPAVDATAYLRAASAERALRAQGALAGVASAFGARLSFARGTAGAVVRGGNLGVQPFTGHQDWSFASRVEAMPAPGHRVSLAHQSGHLYEVPRPDISVPGSVEITKRLDRDAGVLGYTGRLFQRRVRLHAFLGMALQREWRQRLRPAATRDQRDQVLSYQAGFNARTTLWHLATLEVGGGAVLEDIGSGTETRTPEEPPRRTRGRYLDGSRHDTYGLAALLSQGLGDRWTVLMGARASLIHARAPADPLFEPGLAAALRLDRRMFGVAGSVGVRCEIAETLAWVTSALSGFRAPNLEDFQALGTGARGFSIPNPRLDIERSYTLETGIKGEGPIDFQAFVFGTVLDGLVVRVPASLDGQDQVDGSPVQTRDNASQSYLLGLELNLSRRFDSGLFAGASAWATWGRTLRPDPEGGDISEPPSKVPPPTARVQLGYETKQRTFWVAGAMLATLPQTALSESDKNDVRICDGGPSGCARVDGFVTATARAGIQLHEQLTLSLGIENIFDTSYKAFASGTSAPGRNYVASLRGNM